MKRIRPVQQDPESGYPTAREAGLTRRGFFRVAIAGGAAAAGSVVLDVDDASSQRLRGRVARPRYPVSVVLTPAYTCKRCRVTVASLVGRTFDRRLSKFFADKAHGNAAEAVVRSILRKHRCPELKNAKEQRRLVAIMRAELRKLYKKRTGRRAGNFWVSLRVRTKTSA